MDRRWMVAAVAAATMLVAACGGEDSTRTQASARPEASAPALDAGTPGADAVTVTSLETPVGPVLAVGDGLVLYQLDADPPGQPTCVEDCAVRWPPVVASEVEAADGVSARLSTVVRPDGTSQLAVDGRPAYTFAADLPAEASGQGLGGQWWAIDPDGDVNRTELATVG